MIQYKYKAYAFDDKAIAKSIDSCIFYFLDNGIHSESEAKITSIGEHHYDFTGLFITDKPLSLNNVKVIEEIFEDNNASIEIETFDKINNHTIQ